MSTSSIQRMSYDAPRVQFVEALKKDGCVIVQNFTTLETLEEARREVEPCLNSEFNNSQFGGTTLILTIIIQMKS